MTENFRKFVSFKRYQGKYRKVHVSESRSFQNALTNTLASFNGAGASGDYMIVDMDRQDVKEYTITFTVQENKES